ncbi:MAG: peptidyl-prolyl cis-trans isomerase [Fervidobacterium sp.]
MRKLLLKLLSTIFIVLSFSSILANEDLPIASLKIGDNLLHGTEVYEKEIEDIYEIYESYYGNFDPLFEEPYVRAIILKDLLNEKSISYLASLENISYGNFQEKYSAVSEKDLITYYEENREEIMKDEYVDLDYAHFESQEEAEKFYKLASEKGFEKALEETENVEYDSYDGLKKSETNEVFVDIIFGNYPNNLRLFYNENGNYVFNIRARNDYSTYEQFKESPKYEEAKESIGKEKLNDYVMKRTKELNIEVATGEKYKIWLDILEGKDYEKILKSYYTNVFDNNKSVIAKEPWVISAVISIIEEGKLTEKYESEYENSIRKLYESNYKTFSVLARLRQFDNSETLNLEYNVELSKVLLNYIENGDIMSVLQHIFQNLSQLEELSNSENREIRLKAIEYLYYMYDALEEVERAQEYYDKIINIEPNYKFDREINK